MAIKRLLVEACVGETRAAAFDEADRAVALWLARWSDGAVRPRLGDIREARLRKFDPGLGGAFADFAGKSGEAFVRIPPGLGLSEGQAVRLRIEAEAREGKLPRASVIREAELHRADFDDWLARLPGGAGAAVDMAQPGAIEIADAFESALSPLAQIPGGGRMRLERAAALYAADIDTAGRAHRGSAASRALQVNTAAAAELARQCSLRSLGGLIVLDCIAPLNREAGGKVREAFVTAWRRISPRSAKVQPPSPFGLMEISIAWGETPLAERLLDGSGNPTAETVCLSGLRALQKALGERTMDQLTLRLPFTAHAWMAASGLDLAGALVEKHGPRFDITAADVKSPEVA